MMESWAVVFPIFSFQIVKWRKTSLELRKMTCAPLPHQYLKVNPRLSAFSTSLSLSSNYQLSASAALASCCIHTTRLGTPIQKLRAVPTPSISPVRWTLMLLTTIATFGLTKLIGTGSSKWSWVVSLLTRKGSITTLVRSSVWICSMKYTTSSNFRLSHSNRSLQDASSLRASARKFIGLAWK